MVGRDAPIDGFGIGTSLTTSSDAPALDCAYKLQEYAGRPRRKRSEGKATWPGRKQVYRHYSRDGVIAGDLIALIDEPAEGEPLLRPVMRGGVRVGGLRSFAAARHHAAASLARLPGTLRQLDPHRVPVSISAGLREIVARMDAEPMPGRCTHYRCIDGIAIGGLAEAGNLSRRPWPYVARMVAPT